MMDSLFRVQLAAEQAALARGSGGSYGLYDTQYDCFRENLPVAVSSRDSRQQVGVLVDPILAHSSPGSKPYKQLCGLLTTMVKVNAWDCTHAVSSEVQHYAEASCTAVCEATSAVLAAATAKASGGTSNSRGGSSRSSSSHSCHYWPAVRHDGQLVPHAASC
jgi:hypothetical protein